MDTRKVDAEVGTGREGAMGERVCGQRDSSDAVSLLCQISVIGEATSMR